MLNLLSAPSDTAEHLVIVSLILFLAGAVKGVLGFGQPTVAMALLGFMMLPTRAAALLILPSLVTNTWQIFAGPPVRSAVRRVWPLLLTIAAGTTIGIAVIGTRLGSGATMLLGIVLATYGVIGLVTVHKTIPRAAEPWLHPLIGVATGLVNATTGVSVIPLVPYLHSLELSKEDLVQTLGLCFLTATLALGTGLTLTLKVQLSVYDLVLPLATSLVGMGIGQALRRRIPADKFRRYFLAALVVTGAYLAVHAA